MTDLIAPVAAVIEFRCLAHGRMPTLVLSEWGGDQQEQDQNRRNILLCQLAKETLGPTGFSNLDTGFPVYLPILRQRMAGR